MTRYTRGVLLAFMLGQLVQLLAHFLSSDFDVKTQLIFCAGFGLLLAVAFLAGSHTLRKELDPSSDLPIWQPKKRGGKHENPIN